MNQESDCSYGSGFESSAPTEERKAPIVDLSHYFLDIGPVFAGESASVNLYIINRGLHPLSITSLSTSAPFSVRLECPQVAAGEGTRAVVTFQAPTDEGGHRSVVELVSDDPWKPVLTVPVVARAVAAPETALAKTTNLLFTAGPVMPSDAGTELNYTVEFPPVGPTRTAGTIALAVSKTLPAGARVEFSQPVMPLGRRELSHLKVLLPANAKPVAFNIRIEGQVAAGDQLFTVFSPWVRVPEAFFCPPPPPPCDCPKGTPAPSLNLLDSKAEGLPDAFPPPGKTPAGNPVSTVSAKVEGPKIGECCKGAKFVMTLTVDSQVAGVNNVLTAWFLASGNNAANGLTLKASTKGAANAITNGPNNAYNPAAPPGGDGPPPAAPPPAFTRVELQTKHEVPVRCEGNLCECKIDEETYLSRFELGGIEIGSIEVHWKVTIAGQNCTIRNVTGKIDKILYTRNANVFDPQRDRYIPQAGDDDGDGASNYDEILKGTKTNDPSSKP